jgi:hypothetical protein
MEDRTLKAKLILLAQLQAVDTKLRNVENAREALYARKKELQGDVDRLRAEFRALAAKVDDLEKQRRGKDQELAADRDKLKKWESRLDDLRNAREYAALNREVEGLKRGNTDLQEQVLVLVSEITAQAAKVKEVEARLGEVEAALAEESARVAEESSRQEDSSAALRSQRDAIQAQLPANLVKRYQQLLARRGGVAVVLARDSTCTGCNMGIPAQTFILIQRGETVETCPSCNRVLYLEAMLATATAAQGQV